MHLVDMLALRTVPAAGLYLSLTRRCPLSCAHCSTNSTMSSEEYGADNFVKFVRTITPSTKPEIIYLTGGEALLRPQLVQTVTEICHSVGIKVCLLSGMFFARQDKISKAIDQVIAQVDHFTASLDMFHEREVPRMKVFHVLQTFLERGQDVSFQVTGLNEHDPYLKDILENIQSYFHHRVPILTTYLTPVGRGKQWLAAQKQLGKNTSQDSSIFSTEILPTPCTFVTWPAVTFNGAIVACPNHQVIDGAAIPHLQLGHIATDDWPSIRERYLSSDLMRALRIFGPEYINSKYSDEKTTCDGYCSTCFTLSNKSELPRKLQSVLARPGIQIIEKMNNNKLSERFIERGVMAPHASLVRLGYTNEQEIICND